MDRFVFFAILCLTIVAIVLFFPILLETNAHFDLELKKLVFNVSLYGKIKLVGGYMNTYPGGIALHISKKKAILIAYRDMDSERKRFSFFKTFQPVAFTLTTETGASYLFIVAALHAVFRIYFHIIGGKKETIKNNLWLTDGERLRVSLHSVLFLNGAILLKNLYEYIKEKLSILWRRKKRKSMA